LGDLLYAIAFADAAHGWAVGANVDSKGTHATPVIFATSDSGRTWKAQDASAADSGTVLDSVAFADIAHGWAVGEKVENDAYTPVILAASK
jgi:photosystem II stability/assembly factor-like uncharacterized protein